MTAAAETRDTRPAGAAPARPLPSAVRAVLTLWVGVSIALLFAPVFLVEGFHYTHGWVSAHFATIGRTFAEAGLLDLAGVPVQNNLPLTSAPDIYINWPPLYSYAVALLIRLFGESELVVHLFACTVTLSVAAMIYLTANRAMGRAAGLVGVAVFLNAPIIASYGHMASQLTFCVALLLACLFCLQTARDRDSSGGSGSRSGPLLLLSGVLFCLAVAASWEAVLAAPVLCALAVLDRDRGALVTAVVLGVCGTLTVVMIMVLYFSQYPEYLDALLARLQLRAGFGASYSPEAASLFAKPHFLQERMGATIEKTHLDALKAVLNRFGNIGVLGVSALIALICLRLTGVRLWHSLALVVLLGVFALWALLMPHHTAVHDYQLLLIAPVGALAAAHLVSGIPAGLWRSERVMAGVLLAVMCIGFAYRFTETRTLLTRSQTGMETELLQQMSPLLPENAIVLNPSPDMVPVYYAERHVIRFLTSDAILSEVAEGLRALCADCPFYLVVPAAQEASFRRSLSHFPVLLENAFGKVLQVDLSRLE